MTDNNKIMTREELKEVVSKRKKKKIIIVCAISAAVLAVAIIVGVILWNVLSISPVKRTAEEGRAVGSVGEYDVYYDEFSYLVGIYKSDLEYRYGTIDWDGGSDFAQSCIDEVEEKVSESIKKNYSILMLCEQNGIDVDGREINREVNDKVKEYVEAGFKTAGKAELETGKKAYKRWLAENNLTDAYFRLNIKTNLLEEKLTEKLTEEGTQISYSLENFPDFIKYAEEEDDLIRTTHIYIPRYYPYKDVDIRYETERALEMIEALRAETDEAARYELMNDYIGGVAYLVEGYTMMDKNGIYFFEGMMPDEYFDAVKDLDEYGVSDLVETEDGLYVIMKLPKVASYIDENGELLLESYQMACVARMKNTLEEGLSFACDDFSALILGELTK